MTTAKSHGEEKAKAKAETEPETEEQVEKVEATAEAAPDPAAPPAGLTISTKQPVPAVDARGLPNTGPGRSAGDLTAEADRLEAQAKALRSAAKKAG